MRILVDADACPVKNIIEKVAKIFSIDVIMFIDTSHVLESNYSKIIQVDQGKDAVDLAIISSTKKGDIVITGDYGVASLVLSKGAYAISFNGMYYTNQNIDRLLFERHLSSSIRRSGKKSGHIKKRSVNMDVNFENALYKLCESIKSH
ncbi:MAG: YaiI/YqxD family protein [Clostridiales bacterium]|nr:YaiI/YqxD family protein [Clostridiales bacterium]